MDLSFAHKALKKYFGYDSFRSMQADIIQATYHKKDSLVLMPTGGGKSICYQIPAITQKGVCVVVSPLISLMKDQVESLLENGVSAVYLNSSISTTEQQQVEDKILKQEIDLLYISPEKIVSNNFLFLLKKIDVNLFAIDEAHCISNWGHDFRPEYTQLNILKKNFPTTPIMALTATADKVTRRDIITQLQLEEPQIFISSFDRPNISLNVLPAKDRIKVIIDFIKQKQYQSGIIYCLSRKSTEQVCEKLQAQNISATYYHASMTTKERNKAQEDFINDKIQVVCATVAFGMGIDKSNVRWIVHYNLPKSIESYYQEIGRSGRDGLKADTLLFYSIADVINLRLMLEEGNREQTDIKLAKLERMQQYAESLICRRRILLNYFNENFDKDCGNCDVCKNPPKRFDGTISAQKALSAVYRLNEQASMSMLVNVLRGTRRKEIIERNYHLIKTYGVGKEHSEEEWTHIISQMIQLGLLEIAYDQHYALHLTPLSNEVLFKNKKVEMVKMQTVLMKEEQRWQTKKTKTEILREELVNRLTQLRKDIALEEGIPPYLVINDMTIEDLSTKMPTNEKELALIIGFGERKIIKFGYKFLKLINNFLIEKNKEGTQIKGATYLQTFDLYQKGLSISEIAQQRGMQEITVYAHLAHLYEKGENIDIFHFITLGDVERIDAVQKQITEDKTPLKVIFEALNGEVAYHKIRLALSFLEVKKRTS